MYNYFLTFVKDITRGDKHPNMIYIGWNKPSDSPDREQGDTKMTWRRRAGVRVFKDRGDVGPQKLYVNPLLAPIKESYKHQKKFKQLFVDKELNLGEVHPGSCALGDSVLWIIKTDGGLSLSDTAFRFSRAPLLSSDFGNTRGIIEKYGFKHPVWFNAVFLSVMDKESPEYAEGCWQNCVADWYEMKRYLEIVEDRNPGDLDDIVDPFYALRKIGRPNVKLFADGRLLDEQSEFAYLTEIST